MIVSAEYVSDSVLLHLSVRDAHQSRLLVILRWVVWYVLRFSLLLLQFC